MISSLFPIGGLIWQYPGSGGRRNRHILPYRKAKQTEREDMPMEKGYHKGQELTMSELGLSLEETIPLLYVEGLSTRDFKRAPKPLWGKSGLSRSSPSTEGRAHRALK